jgi:LacI family transcriptional regulator
MRGTGPVDDATRRKVLEAVEILGYKPNLLARGLRTRSGKLLGLMVPEILHETFATFICHVEEACMVRGFTMILGNTREDPAVEERVLENLLGLNVDGIIISQVSDTSSALKTFRDRGIPVVGIDRALQEEEVDHVIVDNCEAGEMAAKYLYSMGHRAVACLQGPTPVRLSRERFEGFRNFYRTKGLEVDSVVGDDFGYETGIVAVRSLLEHCREFTGLWAESDHLAIGAMHELKRLGVQIPQQVSLMGMDDIKTSSMIFPSLTTIQQPYKELCEKAVELLIERMADPGLPIRKVVMSPSLVIRDTVQRI